MIIKNIADSNKAFKFENAITVYSRNCNKIIQPHYIDPSTV